MPGGGPAMLSVVGPLGPVKLVAVTEPLIRARYTFSWTATDCADPSERCALTVLTPSGTRTAIVSVPGDLSPPETSTSLPAAAAAFVVQPAPSPAIRQTEPLPGTT